MVDHTLSNGDLTKPQLLEVAFLQEFYTSVRKVTNVIQYRKQHGIHRKEAN